jgi:hypothetical protein
VRAGLILAMVALGACSFNATGLAPDGPPADAAFEDRALPDAELPDAAPDAADSGACPEDIHLVIRVNGVEKAPLATPEKVLLGDTVQLDAEGSCSRLGPLGYTWITTPLGSSILPDGHAPAVSAVALEPMTYLVRLDLAAGGRMKSVEVVGFQATPFRELTPIGTGGRTQVNGLAVGPLGTDRVLWVATAAGAFEGSLATIVPPAAEWTDVQGGGVFSGDSFSTGAVRSVMAHPHAARVYFGSDDAGRDEILVLDTTTPTAVTRTLAHLMTQMAGNFQTFAFAPRGASGVYAGTSRGLTLSGDLGTTWGDRVTPFSDDSIPALVEAEELSPVYYAGGKSLYDLSANAKQSLTSGNDMMRGLAFDRARSLLWAATSGSGVVGLDRSPGVLPFPTLYPLKVGVYDMPSDTVRAIALDPDGDLWMATAQGIARFKRDRATVIKFDGTAGVSDLNLLAVAVEPGGPAGRPRVFFGTSTKGVLALEAR